MLTAADAAATLTLPVMPPFHLEGTVRLLQRQPSNRVDAWDRGRYLRVLPTVQGLRLLTVENLGTIDAPNLRGLVFGGSVTTPTLDELRRILTRILGLAVDPAPFSQAARDRSPLRIAVHALRGVRPPRFPTLFETLANVIPFQQVSLAAGVAVVGRIVEQGLITPAPEAVHGRIVGPMRPARGGVMVRMKRIYEPAAATDGYRVLVERLWPRGVSKAAAHLDAWENGIAPSDSLRRWYNHDPQKWEEFQARYEHELQAPEARELLERLTEQARQGPLTLLYASHAGEISNAAVLERLLTHRLTGPRPVE